MVTHQDDDTAPSIFGRERALVDKVTGLAHKALRSRYDHTDPRETRRGSTFDLMLSDDGHVARVTVEMLPRAPASQRIEIGEADVLGDLLDAGKLDGVPFGDETATHQDDTRPVPYGADRRAVPGERCTCGRPAVVVFVTERFGEVGYCGTEGARPLLPCLFCGSTAGHGEDRCPDYPPAGREL